MFKRIKEKIDIQLHKDNNNQMIVRQRAETKDNHDEIFFMGMVENHMRILRESGDLLAKTTNPQTFFGRYEDFLAAASRLAAFSEAYPLPNKGKIRDEMEKAVAIMRDDSLKTTLLIRFFDRALNAGKGNLLSQEIWKYAHLITPDAMTYWEANMGNVSSPYENKAGEYMVCWVSFESAGKTYCYLSDDPSLQIGDEVIVPVGNYGKESVAIVEKIAYYDTDEPLDFPYPLSKMKRIVSKAHLERLIEFSD